MNPGSPMKATTEEIIAAYRETGSVWRTAKRLGMSGQSVWERLRLQNYPMRSRTWTSEEKAELERLIEQLPIGKIAERLGRPYAGVALMASRMGICTRIGNRIARKAPRGYGKIETQKLAKALAAHGGSLRQFALSRGLALTSLVEALKVHAPEFWAEYSARNGLPSARCGVCGATYFPLSKKQKACSARCNYALRQDEKYFGGKRSQTIGLAQGICQLCGKHRERGLHSHHVYGKENDPENEVLVALCPGCHSIIGNLARMKLTATSDGWEALAHFVEARKRGPEWSAGTFGGTFVAVTIENLAPEELDVLEIAP